MLLSRLLLLISFFGFGQGNPLYLKYVKDIHKSRHCERVTPGLVTTVINQQFTTNLTIIVFDEIYSLDINFKWLLNDILTNLEWSTVKFGLRRKNGLDRALESERPGWVVFSSQMEAYPGPTLLISHVSVFQVKEWLVSPVAKKFMDVVALSDPALLRFKGGEKDCDVNLYTHKLNVESLGGAQTVLVTSWRGNKFSREVDFFPNKYRHGYKGSHLTIAIQEQPPFAFKRYESGNDFFWDGLEVRLIRHLSRILNFTYEFKEDKVYWKDGDVSEAVASHQADLGMGRQVATHDLYTKVTIAYPHTDDCAAFMSLTSTALPKYRAIMGPFLWDVWLALTATYLLAVVPLAFSAWHTIRPLLQNPALIEEMFWYVFGTFTNLFTFKGKCSWTKGDKCSTKLFIGTYWVFTIIVTACYTGSIIAFITLPVYPDVIDTMHQLLHGNYRVITQSKYGWWDLLIGANDDDASGLAGTAEIVNDFVEGFSTVIGSIKEDKPCAFFGSKEHLTYIIKTNYTNSKVGKRQMFHISRECFVTQMISFTLPLGSLYLESLNNAIIRSAESGVIAKFYKDLEWEMYKSSAYTLIQGSVSLEAMERELTLDDTQGMFLLLGIGFGLATAAWVLEVGSWAKGRDLWALGKESSLGALRRVSRAFLAPTRSHLRHHYPLYFRSDIRRRSSIFGSVVADRPPAFSQIHLKPNTEKPIRLLSF